MDEVGGFGVCWGGDFIDFVGFLEKKGEVLIFFESEMSGEKFFDKYILCIIGTEGEKEEVIGWLTIKSWGIFGLKIDLNLDIIKAFDKLVPNNIVKVVVIWLGVEGGGEEGWVTIDGEGKCVGEDCGVFWPVDKFYSDVVGLVGGDLQRFENVQS